MPTQAPYGDIVSISFPKTEQARNQLYREQLQRQLYQQQEDAQLQKQIASQTSRMRSADTPAMFEKYNKYRDLSKKLLFDKKLQRDPQAYNQVRQLKDQALADTFGHIEKSAELNQMGKDLLTSRRSHPDVYDDDFGDKIQTFQNTPMEQLGDLANPDSFRYKGSNTDFGKLHKNAAGISHQVYSKEEQLDANNLQTKVTPYSYGNSPAQYHQSMLGQFQQHAIGRDASAAWDTVTMHPEVIDHVNEEFAKITPEQWQQMTGSEKPQIIEPTDPNNKADQYASFLAKTYAINNLPQEGKPVFRTNQANVIAEKTANQKARDEYQFKNRVLLQKYAQHNAEARIALHHDYKVADEETRDSIADAALDSIDQSGKPTDGGRQINLPQVVSGHIFGAPDKQHPQPDQVVKLSNGDYQARYFKVDDKGATVMKDGKPELAESLTKTIPATVVKLGIKEDLAKGMQTKSKPKAAPATKAPLEDLRKKYNY